MPRSGFLGDELGERAGGAADAVRDGVGDLGEVAGGNGGDGGDGGDAADAA